MSPQVSKLKHHAHQSRVWFQKKWVSAKKLATDGCSGIPDLGLTDYCDQHDADYTPGSGVSRIKADFKLAKGVWTKANTTKEISQKALYYVLTPVIFIGVRLVGWLYYQKVKKTDEH